MQINLPDVVAEVTAAFNAYERALVANDVAHLDDAFWRSALTMRYGIAENLYGFEEIAHFRASRAAINMTRDLMNTKIVAYGPDVASANTEFRRKGAALSGRQSQTWIRTEAGWKIAAAHVSLMPAPK